MSVDEVEQERVVAHSSILDAQEVSQIIANDLEDLSYGFALTYTSC